MVGRPAGCLGMIVFLGKKKFRDDTTDPFTRNCFGPDREFDMPFVDSMGQQAFKLNKTRSYGLRGCCILGCKAHFDKSCLKLCCSYDNDYSNLSVNRNGYTDYYIHQIQGRLMK